MLLCNVGAGASYHKDRKGNLHHQRHQHGTEEERCPKCGSIMHRHGVMMRRLRDIDLIGYLSIIEALESAATIPRCRISSSESLGIT